VLDSSSVKKCFDTGRIGGDCKEIHAVSHSYPLQLKQEISGKGVVQMLRQMLSKYEARQSSFVKQFL